MIDLNRMGIFASIIDRQPRRIGIVAVVIAVSLVAVSCGQEPADTDRPDQVSPPASAASTPVAQPETQPTVPPAAAFSRPLPVRTVVPSAQPQPAPTPTPLTPTVAIPVPTAAPSATPPPVPIEAQVDPSQAPVRDLFDLALRFRSPSESDPSRFVASSAAPLEVGHKDEFFVTKLADGTVHTITATVQLVSEHAYWFVDDATSVATQSLQDSADAYEEIIHPAVVGAFGDIWDPGVDGDPRLAVLHTVLSGAVGYYGSKDEFPQFVHPYSNEREIIYMDTRSLRAGSDGYLGVLAHELQHAIHWNQDTGEDSWVNEGLSEAATSLAGYTPASADAFLRKPETQLNWWPDQLQNSYPHYGASNLFFNYLAQRLGSYDVLGDLVAEQRDGAAGVDAFLRGFGLTFTGVFQDWVVANHVDAAEGPYAYPGEDVSVKKVFPMIEGSTLSGTLPQFSARYYGLPASSGRLNVSFVGDAGARLMAAECPSGTTCWWSGAGDAIDVTLTRAFDLTELTSATLEFNAWHKIEKGWDYGYVEVSADGGLTWEILPGSTTTADNPSGNSYGHGYTGATSGWSEETVDLTPYVGGEVLVRFEYVTDDAVYLDGLFLDDFTVPELGFVDDGEADAGWDARGFTRVNGDLTQRFAVQLVERYADGDVRVSRMTLDGENAGAIAVEGTNAGFESAVVIVAPITMGARQPASFKISVSSATDG